MFMYGLGRWIEAEAKKKRKKKKKKFTHTKLKHIGNPIEQFFLIFFCPILGISLTVLAMLVAVHNLYPSLSTYTAPFFQLSYYQPSTGLYVQGWDDIYFVASSLIIFMAIRAIAIEWIIQPLARKSGMKRKPAIRFAEQGWIFLYYSFVWVFGMVRIYPVYFVVALLLIV